MLRASIKGLTIEFEFNFDYGFDYRFNYKIWLHIKKMKVGQKIIIAGIIGTILKIGEKRIIKKVDPSNPLDSEGTLLEVQDIYVKFKLPSNKVVKGWWPIRREIIL